MADNNIFLIRKTGGLWTKYSNVSSVILTGQPIAYGGVTGVASTGIITITGSTLFNGYQAVFQSINGGTGLVTGQAYYVINASGSTCQLAYYEGGPPVTFVSNITSGSILITNTEFRVWSSEYRDIFAPKGITVSAQPAGGGTFITPTVASMTAATVSDVELHDASPTAAGWVSGTINETNSDEIGHNPLRQTLLKHTFWQFNISGQTPTVLYADFLLGDIISNNPPQTA